MAPTWAGRLGHDTVGQAMVVSARTLLRLVRRMLEAQVVRVLGVDDWCKRRG